MTLYIGAFGYNFEQTVASTTWVINHALGHLPSVDTFILIDGQLTVVLPLSVQVSTTQVTVTFSEPRVGKTRLV